MKKKSNQQACADAMTDSPPSPPSSDAAADEPAEIKRTRSSPHGGSPRVAVDDEKAAAARELRDDTPTTADDAPSSPRKGFVKASELLAAEAEGDAGEASFPEYCQRPDPTASPDEVAITFAEETGKGFYDQVQTAIEDGDTAPFFDFSHMPQDWEVPAAAPREGSIA